MARDKGQQLAGWAFCSRTKLEVGNDFRTYGYA